MTDVQVTHATTRSRLMLEIASELVGRENFSIRQASVSLRMQGSSDMGLEFFGGDGPDQLFEVASGKITAAIINPSALLTVACNGVSPFRGPLPLRPIAVIPSYDQLVFAVPNDLGITHVEDLARLKPPLRVSMRGQRSHSVHLAVDHVLQAAGSSVGDIRAWGGDIFYDDGSPKWNRRVSEVCTGSRDAIFDEAVRGWIQPALEANMRILSLHSATVKRLITWGYRGAILPRGTYPGLDYDVATIDFSGFAVYVHEEADDLLVTQLCEAINARKNSIQLSNGELLSPEQICVDTMASPIGVPLHEAARACWQRLGHLNNA